MVKCEHCEIVDEDICCKFCPQFGTCGDQCSDTEDCEILKKQLNVPNEKSDTNLPQKLNDQNQLIVNNITAAIFQIDALKKRSDDLKKQLLAAFEKNGIKKYENKNIIITYVAPTTKNSFDSKEFKTMYADLYHEFTKTSPVKSNLRIKLK